ncbi:histidinol dehydrogenase [Shinella sp. PSBB067]|uniref:histidinol dehydrogenase n=1 Tax=Shinella sp. PSBB067 TaxID=2715959 RepID=UPI00193B33AD|nr:histidinol dehydrogenase [Shinella sp. PSBB067]QRI62754.1 histidinol dehydrogenase [Shinella sp. PSBB067]
MSETPISIHKLCDLDEAQRKSLLQRTENDLSAFMEKVIPIIDAVRRDGDKALADFANRFDKAPIAADQIRATPGEFAAARASIDRELIETLEFAAKNIRHFHERQMPETLALHETHPGVLVGDRWNAIDSVACYVPRGKGSFPSSVLMTAIPAKVAGVKKVVVITPPGPDGTVDPATLVAAEIAGVADVFKCGGAQGIAAVAFGTQTVPKCDKVVGPGSPWVVAAKKQLSSVIDPGSPAGPSELIVFSDGTVPPELVALDLCVESEHGPDSSVFFVTDSEDFAHAVASRIPAFWSQMGDVRAQYSKTVLSGPRGGIVVTRTKEEAFAFVNDYAPEHLAVLADNAWQYLTRFEHAGEILLGPHSAISIANFVLGPSHVLPTGAAAKTMSPLAVFDFLKRTSIASLSEAAYESFAGHAERLARYEGFDGHANAVSSIRDKVLHAAARTA